jgi:nitrogen fixation NifU-like protein
MMDMRELYQEVILDHNKKPRNYYKLETATQTAEGYNPLCGDKVTIYLIIEDDRVRDISFQGSGCAISMASASMMTEGVKGKALAEVQALFEKFHTLVTQETSSASEPPELGKLVAFGGVREFPIRVKCATLAWHTLRAAIERRQVSVSSEESPDSRDVLKTQSLVVKQELQEKIVGVLRQIHDPEIPVNLYDLGLIYDIVVEAPGSVIVKMTLTTPACPMASLLIQQVQSNIQALPGVTSVKVELVWDPPWDQHMMSEAAKLQLGLQSFS